MIFLFLFSVNFSICPNTYVPKCMYGRCMADEEMRNGRLSSGYLTCFWHVFCSNGNPREEGIALLHLLPNSRTSPLLIHPTPFYLWERKQNLNGNNLMQIFREGDLMDNRVFLPHIWNHVLWHEKQRETASWWGDPVAQGISQSLSGGKASTCMPHPWQKMWLACRPFAFGGTMGRQKSPPWTYWGHKGEPHDGIQRSPGPPRLFFLRTSWTFHALLTTARHKHLFQRPKARKMVKQSKFVQTKYSVRHGVYR